MYLIHLVCMKLLSVSDSVIFSVRLCSITTSAFHASTPTTAALFPSRFRGEICVGWETNAIVTARPFGFDADSVKSRGNGGRH